MYNFLEKASRWFLGVFDVQYHGDFLRCIKDLASSNTFWFFCLLLLLFAFSVVISHKILSVLTSIFLLLIIFNVDIEDKMEQFPKHFNTTISKVQDKLESGFKTVFRK